MRSSSKKYGVDKNGFISTKASLSKIKKPFSKIVAGVKENLLEEFADQIHSIYIYGSVATGEAKPKKSDLDMLVVFKKKPSAKLKSQIENLSEKLSKKYKTLLREVGIALSDVKEVHADTYGWGCFIKHLCVDIYGENLSAKLPKFKPTEKVAQAFNGDCKKVVASAIKKLSHNPNKEEVRKICSSTMRKIVRTGFSLVMDQEKSWTTDLNKSYLTFAKYHPEQKSQMKMVLETALTPTNSKEKLLKLLKELKPLLLILNFSKNKPSTEVIIREAEPKDAKSIATIHVRTWQHAYKGQIPDRILDGLSIEERTEKWEKKLKKPDKNAKTFVAIVDNKVQGFSSSGPSRDKDSNETNGELYAVYIAAERFGSGLGHSLVNEALSYLRKLDFKKATLWVLDTNENAIKFYEKEGWHFDGKTKVENSDGFKLKEIRMIKAF